jgi:hypothetical protein
MPNGKTATGKKIPDNTGKKIKKSIPDKQKILASLILENTGKPPKEQKTMQELMKEAGYSDGYAKNPQDLKQTSTWQQLMDKKVPEKKEVNKLAQLLEAAKLASVKFPLSMTEEQMIKVVKKIKGAKVAYISRGIKWAYVNYTIPDNSIQLETLKEVHKTRGRYKTDQIADKTNENMERALDRLSQLLPDAEL